MQPLDRLGTQARGQVGDAFVNVVAFLLPTGGNGPVSREAENPRKITGFVVVVIEELFGIRAVAMLDGQRELMGNAVDAHLAIINNRMNSVMKKMTSWGAILLG